MGRLFSRTAVSKVNHWEGIYLKAIVDKHFSHLLRKPSEYIPDILDSSLSPSKNNPPSFDVYLRQISSCSSIAEAYRIRDSILAEIEKKGLSIGIFQAWL